MDVPELPLDVFGYLLGFLDFINLTKFSLVAPAWRGKASWQHLTQLDGNIAASKLQSTFPDAGPHRRLFLEVVAQIILSATRLDHISWHSDLPVSLSNALIYLAPSLSYLELSARPFPASMCSDMILSISSHKIYTIKLDFSCTSLINELLSQGCPNLSVLEVQDDNPTLIRDLLKSLATLQCRMTRLSLNFTRAMSAEDGILEAFGRNCCLIGDVVLKNIDTIEKVDIGCLSVSNIIHSLFGATLNLSTGRSVPKLTLEYLGLPLSKVRFNGSSAWTIAFETMFETPGFATCRALYEEALRNIDVPLIEWGFGALKNEIKERIAEFIVVFQRYAALWGHNTHDPDVVNWAIDEIDKFDRAYSAYNLCNDESVHVDQLFLFAATAIALSALDSQRALEFLKSFLASQKRKERTYPSSASDNIIAMIQHLAVGSRNSSGLLKSIFSDVNWCKANRVNFSAPEIAFFLAKHPEAFEVALDNFGSDFDPMVRDAHGNLLIEGAIDSAATTDDNRKQVVLRLLDLAKNILPENRVPFMPRRAMGVKLLLRKDAILEAYANCLSSVSHLVSASFIEHCWKSNSVPRLKRLIASFYLRTTGSSEVPSDVVRKFAEELWRSVLQDPSTGDADASLWIQIIYAHFPHIPAYARDLSSVTNGAGTGGAAGQQHRSATVVSANQITALKARFTSKIDL